MIFINYPNQNTKVELIYKPSNLTKITPKVKPSQQNQIMRRQIKVKETSVANSKPKSKT